MAEEAGIGCIYGPGAGSVNPPPRRRNQLLIRVERHLESSAVLGFGVGEGEDVVDFLARLEMEAVEHLLRSGLADAERELVLNWIEERKGELGDDELPAAEARRRSEHRERLRRWR